MTSAIQASNPRLRPPAGPAGAAALATDARGRVLRASAAAATLLNCPGHLLGGVPLAAFVDAPALSSFRRLLRFARGRPDFEETVLVLRPLRKRPLHAHVSVATAAATLRPPVLFWVVTPFGAGAGGERASEHLARQIGRELHDQAAQMLASAHLALEAMRPELAPALQQRLCGVRSILRDVEADLRRMGRWLASPELEDGGLRRALEAVAATAASAGAAIRVEGEAPEGLAPRTALQLHRIAQEAVSNAVRHGGARNVELRLRTDGRWLSLMVRDDGRGFDPGSARGGLGLASMRERARLAGGRLRIVSKPGAGARVVAVTPLAAPWVEESPS